MANEGNILLKIDEVKAQTEKGILCRIGNDEIWFPLSQVNIISDPDGGQKIEIPTWLANKKGLV